MRSGNPVPGARGHNGGVREQASQQVKDIQEIIAKLEVVTKRLSYPLRTMPQSRRTRDQAGGPEKGPLD
jgi:hypothetical protein